MNYLNALEEILREFAEAVSRADESKKPFDGIFGIGGGPSSDPCHQAMDQAVERLALQAAGLSPDGDGQVRPADARTAEALTEAILTADDRFDGPEYAHLSLIAAQRHCLSLIPLLTAEGKKRLLDWYRKKYPRYCRFPRQKDVIAALSAKGN